MRDVVADERGDEIETMVVAGPHAEVERVELAVLAAGIAGGGQIIEQACIERGESVLRDERFAYVDFSAAA